MQFGLAAVGDHALEVGVGLKLRRVGGLGPAVQGSFHPLHGQVGAFDNAQFDGHTAAGAARHGPGGEILLDGEGLRQVGLQDNPSTQRQELRLVQHLCEGRHGQV